MPQSISQPIETFTNKQRLWGAISRSPIDRPPVWLMRQAGRYLPAYQEVKKKYNFMELCRIPEMAAEVSIQPYEILGVDGIIVFNDILIPLEHMGLKVEFTDKGPAVTPPIHNKERLKILHKAIFDEEPPVHGSIAEIRKQVGQDIPVFGFAGAPFTLATYMVEGSTGKNLRYIKEFLYTYPELLEQMLDVLTETVIEYLLIQIRAGADFVQIFDTWAGTLSRSNYRRFALPFQKRIIETIQAEGTPVILYVKGSSHVLHEMKESGASVISVDWLLDLTHVSHLLGDNVVLQGNLDPTALYAPPETVRKMVLKLLDEFPVTTGHIFNLGHGILPETPVECVQTLIETVKRYEYKNT